MDKDISINELDIKVRSYVFLKKNELMTVSDLCAKLDEGIDNMLKMPRITVKVTIDLLKAVKPYSYPSGALAEKYLAEHKDDGTISPENLMLWEDLLQTINS